ncbi:hypothetical protein GJ654_18635 [Rhodoblastus acidophilus]|uniref:Uncharacterized protein n=1 Tax=Rhodoblastus acidophilus TaxID=1074 RepID=A0A6N8DR11_RHOAC|nr:hypothetical protein [Rhodoblastus acidophilus]MCW2276344.1 MoxR-like ATPase [Rhodoblastus acidophilus]MTV33000.1 hypothetical protein [Rhodoblastus acidophilus]
MKTIHVYDRRKIMQRAHQIARQTREQTARKAFDLDVRIVGAMIIHNKPLSAHIAATPVDFAAAMRTAWAEAKGANVLPRSQALTIARPTPLAPFNRRMRFARVFRLLSSAARWVGARFIPSRAA